MRTEDLIRVLAKDLRATPSHMVGRRIALGTILGGAIASLVLATTIGVRDDLLGAIEGVVFWMKFAYAGSLALVATQVTADLARPEGARSTRLLLLAVPVVLLASVATAQLARSPSVEWVTLSLGRTWTTCPTAIFLLSIPIFIGLGRVDKPAIRGFPRRETV